MSGLNQTVHVIGRSLKVKTGQIILKSLCYAIVEISTISCVTLRSSVIDKGHIVGRSLQVKNRVKL